MKNLITSCGIIKNRTKPRVGVIAANSNLLGDWVHDEISQGIDLTFEEYILDLESEGKTEEEIEELVDCYESDYSIILFGDAWVKNKDGKYSIDKSKNFAASYCSDTNIISVEYSQTTGRCHHTSPCYIMADGSGPCGDLDTEGTEVIAFDLPENFYK